MAKRYTISFWGNESFLKLTVVMGAKFCEYTKSHWIYMLSGRIIWYVNHISIKLLKSKKKAKYKTTKLLGSIPANWFIARSYNCVYLFNNHLKYYTWKWKLFIHFSSNMVLYKMFDWLFIWIPEIWGICLPAYCSLPPFLPYSFSVLFSIFI